LQRTGNGKRNQYKKIIQIKIVHKSGGFAPLEYKSSWIFKQLEIIGEKYGFKITDAIEKFRENDGNDFEWRKKNSRLTQRLLLEIKNRL
jgi:hypothetical protein